MVPFLLVKCARQRSCALLALIVMISPALSCGGGGPQLSLTVIPPSAELTSIGGDLEQETLKAVLSDGVMPSNVRWTTSDACVPVNQSGVVVCNGPLTCAEGTIVATITATAQGLKGTSSITCNIVAHI